MTNEQPLNTRQDNDLSTTHDLRVCVNPNEVIRLAKRIKEKPESPRGHITPSDASLFHRPVTENYEIPPEHIDFNASIPRSNL